MTVSELIFPIDQSKLMLTSTTLIVHIITTLFPFTLEARQRPIVRSCHFFSLFQFFEE